MISQMKNDRVHYYDGPIYKRLVDRANIELRSIIAGYIDLQSKVIDIGCGTGALAFDLSKRCSFVFGIDTSSKMVTFAKERKQREEIDNVFFIHGGIDYLSKQSEKQFDYAVFSMSLHEMNHEERISMLTEAKRLSRKIIIADYLVPQTSILSNMRISFVEFIAGINHFRGYINFKKIGGIDGLIRRCGLKIIRDKINSSKTVRIVLAE